MARREPGEDPKAAALREARCLNPHPERVSDAAFLAGEFFDARDAVQVKYEMVRAVTVDKVPVTAAAAAFGYSRPSYYQAAAALERSGLEGLVPARPGPRRAHKLTAEILAWAEQALAADPALRPAALAVPIEANFGVRAHAEVRLDRHGQGGWPQCGVGGQRLLGPGQDLRGELVRPARPGPGRHQSFQPGSLQRGGCLVVRGPGVPERRRGGGDRHLVHGDGAHHLVLDLDRVAGVEELPGQERRIGHPLGMRVQAPRLAQRRCLRVLAGFSPGHAAS